MISKLIPTHFDNARHKKGHDMAYLIEGFGAIKLHNCYPLAWNLNASKSWKMFSINKTLAISKGFDAIKWHNCYVPNSAHWPFGLLFQNCTQSISVEQGYIFFSISYLISNVLLWMYPVLKRKIWEVVY